MSTSNNKKTRRKVKGLCPGREATTKVDPSKVIKRNESKEKSLIAISSAIKLCARSYFMRYSTRQKFYEFVITSCSMIGDQVTKNKPRARPREQHS
jgi:hypothetical protein